MASLSELPDVVLVNIMSYLSLPDRGKLAQTCHSLNEAFHHPTLWYTMSVKLLSCNSRNEYTSKIFMPSKYVTLIEKFGNYVQNLDLVIQGYPSGITSDVKNVLKVLRENCRLETLSLSIGTVLSKRDYYWQRSRNLNFEGILVLIENAFRLKTLEILSWPIHREAQSLDLFEAVKRNEKVKERLENLNLFWRSAADTSWVTVNAHLPSPDEVFAMIQELNNLKTLRLQSPMMSDALVYELGKKHRQPLQKLSILVAYSRHNDKSLPEISSKAWQQLGKKSPKLMVDFTFSTRVPYIELAGLLKPEIPVVAISFMKYSECRNIDLQSIADKYSCTLTEFRDYSQSISVITDDVLIDFVTKCTKLRCFVFNGTVHHQTVTQLAKLQGSNWQHFQIDSENVTTADILSDDDENQVLRQNEDGTYNVVAVSKWNSENDPLTREARIAIMVQEVGEYLQKKWLPIDWLAKDDAEEQKIKLYDGIFPKGPNVHLN